MKLSAIAKPVTETIYKVGRFNLRLYTGSDGKQVFDPIDCANFVTAIRAGELSDAEINAFIVKVEGLGNG
jgi:hypothetical protein